MAEEAVAKYRNTKCSICGSGKLIQILDLPEFPLTGIYVDERTDGQYRGIDQGLVVCEVCRHGQLMYIIDPNYIYDGTYTYRTSESPIATAGNDFFIQFLNQVTKGQAFDRIVEIGCNDLYLSKKLQNIGKYYTGIDSIWRDQEPEFHGNVKVIGKFIEEVDLDQDLEGRPDLILSAHTLEHVADPKTQLAKLMDFAVDGALFVCEVPGFDSLVTNSRFDQVFHQHIHYFSLASFQRMIYEIGGDYLTHTFNYDFWGGTMLVAFRKRDNFKPRMEGTKGPSEKLISKRYEMFRDQLAGLMKTIDYMKEGPIYGYGAAQILPTLAYHLQSDLSFLEGILDDNPSREGLTYPQLPVRIFQPHEKMTLEGASVLITALDSIRPILKRITPMKPRHILVPLNLI